MLLAKFKTATAMLPALRIGTFLSVMLAWAVLSLPHENSAADTSALPALLTIGSPSPKLVAMKYIRGDIVKELSAGTIYVVEFSGTKCVPCIECIPHMNELQKKHGNVVFISIYPEKENVIREFLAGKGKDIAVRVASDPAGGMWRTWHEPAIQDGIPCAFIVGKDEKIAWIGHPAELADPLDQVVAGTYEPQEHAIRLKVEQEAALRLRRANEREEKGAAEFNRILDMHNTANALADIEKALVEYRDCPRATQSFRYARVYKLANLPGKQEEAFKVATELAIEAKMSGRYELMLNTAKALLSVAAGAKPGARDNRYIDLALPLLCEPSSRDLDQRHQPENVLRDKQITTLRFRGYAFHLRGDTIRATGSIREAIAMIRDRKPPPGVDEKTFAEEVKRRLEDYQAFLKEYSGDTAPSPKE